MKGAVHLGVSNQGVLTLQWTLHCVVWANEVLRDNAIYKVVSNERKGRGRFCSMVVFISHSRKLILALKI
jgi:hypothetical protein